MINVLIISRSPWRKDNSFGNTYSNLFGNLSEINIANIYLADGIPDPDNRNVSAYFRISEKQVLRSLFLIRSKRNEVGEIIDAAHIQSGEIFARSRAYKNAQQIRWPLLYMIREWIWRFGQINYRKLYQFIDTFKPDIIFLPFYYAKYVDRVALKIKKKFNLPIILEASIDIYTLRQFSFDPFYWINRFSIRKMIRKTAKQASFLFVISERQKKDYQKIFGLPTEVLSKHPDPTRSVAKYIPHDKPLRFLFTGIIGGGRWETLSLIGDVIKQTGAGTFDIYTSTPITRKMKSKLRNCILHTAVSFQMVKELQESSDVLVHAESFGLKNRLETRYAVSTKIMDYISSKRCILAVCPEGLASLDFLEGNNLAIVANKKTEIIKRVREISETPSMVAEFAKRCEQYCSEYNNDDKNKVDLLAVIKEILSRKR